VWTGVDRQVTVEVEGPAVLAGLGTGDPSTEEKFSDGSRTTFRGRALGVIRATGDGHITVTVSADGLSPVALQIAAETPRG
jgi:hypothetical protein